MKNDRCYTVYMHTNIVNGKKYIGITCQKPERRWQNGYGYIKTYFGNAIIKYGWDNFEHEIIADGLSKETACQMEIALIRLFRTNEREYGYNISDGGETCDCLTNRFGEDHPNHQRVKMIDPQTHKVIRVFGAQAEAARVLGISRKGITKACRGKGTATYKGYIWEYADKKYTKPGNPGVGHYDHANHYKPVIVLYATGEAMKYQSVQDACRAENTPKNSANRYLKKGYADPKGRRWFYAEIFQQAE